jgi:hypothetical protein
VETAIKLGLRTHPHLIHQYGYYEPSYLCPVSVEILGRTVTIPMKIIHESLTNRNMLGMDVINAFGINLLLRSNEFEIEEASSSNKDKDEKTNDSFVAFLIRSGLDPSDMVEISTLPGYPNTRNNDNLYYIDEFSMMLDGFDKICAEKEEKY